MKNLAKASKGDHINWQEYKTIWWHILCQGTSTITEYSTRRSVKVLTSIHQSFLSSSALRQLFHNNSRKWIERMRHWACPSKPISPKHSELLTIILPVRETFYTNIYTLSTLSHNSPTVSVETSTELHGWVTGTDSSTSQSDSITGWPGCNDCNGSSVTVSTSTQPYAAVDAKLAHDVPEQARHWRWPYYCTTLSFHLYRSSHWLQLHHRWMHQWRFMRCQWMGQTSSGL